MKLQSIVLGLLVLGCASVANADGWLPIWNPFATAAPAKPAAPARVMPGVPQPTLWQRMSSGTQSAWNGTTRMLNPWASQPAPRTPPSGTRRAAPPVEVDQTSWLPWNWFGEDEPGPDYDTPSDWLSQPRP